jgi:hypothetical protein
MRRLAARLRDLFDHCGEHDGEGFARHWQELRSDVRDRGPLIS